MFNEEERLSISVELQVATEHALELERDNEFVTDYTIDLNWSIDQLKQTVEYIPRDTWTYDDDLQSKVARGFVRKMMNLTTARIVYE